MVSYTNTTVASLHNEPREKIDRHSPGNKTSLKGEMQRDELQKSEI